jgi:hypothetical protein
MPVFSPFTVDNWIVATLKATAGATVEVNGVTVPADAVALVADRIQPLRPDWTSEQWPCILYQPLNAPNIDDYAENAVLEDGLYKIFMIMRQDKLADVSWSGDLEEYTKQGYIAISAAFQGVKDPTLGGEGIVHGSSVVQRWQRFYGEPGLYVSEMGVIAHIFST